MTTKAMPNVIYKMIFGESYSTLDLVTSSPLASTSSPRFIISLISFALSSLDGLEAKVTNGENFVNLNVGLGDEMDFRYGVYLTKSQSPDYTRELDGDDLYYRAEVYLKEGGQDYDVLGWSEATLINDVIEQYRKHMQFLHVVRE